MRHSSRAQIIYQSLKGDILHETSKAIQIQTTEGKIIWIPISQCSQILRADPNTPGSYALLLVAEWIMKDKGLTQNTFSVEEQARMNAHTVKRPSESVGRYKSGALSAPPPRAYKDDDDIPF